MMTYAIVTPANEVLGYITASQPPTLEEMADHLAEASGFADRDEWAMANGNPFIGFAQVH
jgi:hypothetical protein